MSAAAPVRRDTGLCRSRLRLPSTEQILDRLAHPAADARDGSARQTYSRKGSWNADTGP
jgi:hypothetical protein